MPYRQEAEIVRAMWREVERAMEGAPAGSDERATLEAEARRLREEHQRLVQLAEAHHRPKPNPLERDT